MDSERLSVGALFSSSKSEWTYEAKHQMGLYSEASITSISYKPEDKYLPTVTVSVDSELNHLARLGVGGMAVAAVFVPEALISMAPNAAEFVNQLGAAAPAFQAVKP